VDMCLQWANDIVKKLTCFDYALIKIGVFAFTLMLAKLWPGVFLCFDWYWYGLVYAIIAAYFIVKIFGKK
jgi:hypothetical protein